METLGIKASLEEVAGWEHALQARILTSNYLSFFFSLFLLVF
jgi:hypothetical protein